MYTRKSELKVLNREDKKAKQAVKNDPELMAEAQSDLTVKNTIRPQPDGLS